MLKEGEVDCGSWFVDVSVHGWLLPRQSDMSEGITGKNQFVWAEGRQHQSSRVLRNQQQPARLLSILLHQPKFRQAAFSPRVVFPIYTTKPISELI